MVRDFLCNHEWSDILGIELFGCAFHFNVTRIQPDLGADTEIWGRNSAVLRSLGVLFNRDAELLLQVVMKGSKVVRMLSSRIGANIVDPDLEPGVVPFICKEWCYLGCGVQSIVIRKFHKQ